jgi:RNA polymerase sigma-70 factor (ECF subfamily)
MSLTESSSTSVSLVDGIRRRLDSDWERYARVYSPLIASWCCARGVRGSNIADLVQQVHAVVVDKIDNFDYERPDATFRGWLYRITANEIVDHRRRARQQRGLSIDPESIPAADEPIGEDLTNDEDRRSLAGLIRRTLQILEAEFAEQTRAAFTARFFDLKGVDEIASELGLSKGAVRARINRAGTKLGELLGPEFPELKQRERDAPPDP